MRKKGMLAALAAFAASPQGRRAMQQAKTYVRSPEGKQKIAELREQAQRRAGRSRSGPPPGR